MSAVVTRSRHNKNHNTKMKKTLFVICCACALVLTVNAQETKKEGAKKPAWTEEQKALRKEMTAKYDANKDGKLDKEERAKISAEDKAKMEKAGLTGAKKKTE